MAIRTKVKAATTHHGNLDDPELKADPDDLFEVPNNQKIAVLVAPDVEREGHSTHSVNARVAKKLKALSIADLPNEDDLGIDNDIDPVYSDEELENSGNQSVLEDPDDSIDPDDVEDQQDFGDLEEVEDEPELLEDPEVIEELPDQELMDVVDVDDIPEEVEEDEVNVAPVESSLLVLHKDRVVAKMTKAQAEDEGVGDEFQSDEFAEVVSSTCAIKGLRRGLGELGFTMTKVNLGASNVLTARVKKQTALATKQIKASMQTQKKDLQACLAIAAVGVNKNFWKDVENPLRSAVEAALLHAGVSNPKSVTAKVFSQNGIAYSKALVTMAARLAQMPSSTRETVAEALDMTSDDFDNTFDDEVEGEVVEEDEDDSDFNDVDASTVEAALSTPMKRGVLLTTKVPVTARSILNSNDILEF